MSDPERHHYIPQFYLRRWANTDGQVSCYSWKRGKIYIREYSPKEIGQQRALYALEGVPPEIRNTIERDFMGPSVDDPAARAMAILLGEEPGPLTMGARRAWVRFLVSLAVRTPQRLDALKLDGAAILEGQFARNPEAYEKIRKPDDPPTFVEFIRQKGLGHLIDNFGTMMIPQLVDIPQMVTDITRMNWRVQHYHGGPYGLVTSDFPLCIMPGLADPTCIVSLPLSPTAFFVAGYDSALLDGVAKKSAQQVIDRMNELSARSAGRDVFADSRLYRALAEENLRKPANGN